MAKIHSLEIKNFRGIKYFNQKFYGKDFICIVGRGDSGKTSILEAISLVLSPNFNLAFYDTDFFNSEIAYPIVITATLYELSENLLSENKYGLHQRFIAKDSGDITDNVLLIEDSSKFIPALTIKVTISSDLEPRWSIINSRTEECFDIKSTDRSQFNTFYISDYIDKHFSFSRGSPLFTLIKNFEKDSEKNIILDVLRNAKNEIDVHNTKLLIDLISAIQNSSSDLGVNLVEPVGTIDFRDLLIKEDKISLHDNVVPLRLKGKGSKRLISLAIQKEIAKVGGIILVDEVEQGLEADRIKHLIRTLYYSGKGQYFITTHSNSVIEEIESENILQISRNDKDNLESQFISSESFQSLMRACPEAMYASKLIVCEGSTEIGMCRALDNHRIEKGLNSFATSNVVYTLGEGTSFSLRAQKLKELGKNVCVLCDSDNDNALSPSKSKLQKQEIKVVDCDSEFCIENQVFNDLPWNGVIELIDYVGSIKPNIKDSIKSKFEGQFPEDTGFTIETPEMRKAIALASITKNNEWFKRVDHGEFLGKICLKYIDDMNGKRLARIFNEIEAWVNND